MEIKKLLEIEKEILAKGNPQAAMEDDDLCQKISDVSHELDKDSEKAVEFLTSRIEEKDIVSMITAISNASVSKAVLQGHTSLLTAQLRGHLRLYTEMIIFAMIGVLLEEEIIRE